MEAYSTKLPCYYTVCQKYMKIWRPSHCSYPLYSRYTTEKYIFFLDSPDPWSWLNLLSK